MLSVVKAFSELDLNPVTIDNVNKNKRRERKGKIQLIDASGFYNKLRKALGNKKNEISAENRSEITKLYAD